MSVPHPAWLVIWAFGRRWFAPEAAAVRYLAHHDTARDGPAVLVGLDTMEV